MPVNSNSLYVNEMRQPITVLVYPVRFVDGEWEYLILNRVPRPDLGLPRFWQGVTGSLEDDETPDTAAERELMEETALVASSVQRIGFSYTIPMQDEWKEKYAPGVQKIVEHVFVAIVAGEQEPALSGEHNQWQWCRKEKALALLRYPGNIEALKRCATYLESHDKMGGGDGQ